MPIFNMTGGENDSLNKLTIKHYAGTVAMNAYGAQNQVNIPTGKELIGMIINVLDKSAIKNGYSYCTSCTITILKQNDVIFTSVLDYAFEETTLYRVSDVDLKNGTFTAYSKYGGSSTSLISLFLK